MPRNSSGTYTLPTGNPVVPNTLIDTNWANPTMSDIGSSITDSLDRFGRGGMLAQLKLADGTLVQPAFAFNSESSTGLLRPSAGTFQVSVLGALIATFSSTGTLFALAPSYAADPVSANQLARKSYVDGLVATGPYLPLAGGTMTGAILHALGTVGAPGMAFAGDPNTGIYSQGADQLAIATGGAAAIVVDAAQRVGLRITPQVSLHVLSSTPAASPAWLAADTAVISATTNNVMQLHAGASGGTLGYAFSIAGLRGVAGMNYIPGSNTLQLYTNGTIAQNIDANQNIGFGTTPQAWFSSRRALVLSQGGSFASSVTAVSDGTMELWANSYLDSAGAIRYASNGAANVLQLNTSGAGTLNFLTAPAGIGGAIATTTNRFAIDVSGNVLIGTTTPGFSSAGRGLLEVNGATSAIVGLKIANVNAGLFYHDGTNAFLSNLVAGNLQLATNNVTRMQISSAGVIADAAGNELGFKDIPRTTGGFTRGQCFAVSAGQTVNTQATGNAFSVYNDSAANITLTQGAGLTLRLNGTTSTGNRTLLARGFATIWYNAAGEAVISGAVT